MPLTYSFCSYLPMASKCVVHAVAKVEIITFKSQVLHHALKGKRKQKILCKGKGGEEDKIH